MGLEEIQSVHKPGVKVVVVVHYAGVSYDHPAIAAWCEQEGIMLVEEHNRWALGTECDSEPIPGRFGALAIFMKKPKTCSSVVNQESLWDGRV